MGLFYNGIEIHDIDHAPVSVNLGVDGAGFYRFCQQAPRSLQSPFRTRVACMISPLDQLMNLLAKLPGLGPRSARRTVLHLLKRREVLMLPLIEAMQNAVHN